jgi:hypothetical protein
MPRCPLRKRRISMKDSRALIVERPEISTEISETLEVALGANRAEEAFLRGRVRVTEA